MAHWRQEREEGQRGKVFDPLAAVLFYVILALPVLVVWGGVSLWRAVH